MHSSKTVTVALLVSFLLPALSRADNGTVRKELESQMARFQQAFRRKDVAALRSITTPDFTMKAPNGRVSRRREAEVAMIAEMKSIRSIKQWTLTIEKLAVKGDVATAIVNERMTAEIAGPFDQPHTEVSQARIRETWVKTRAGWRYKRSELVSSSSGPPNMSFLSTSQEESRKPEYTATRKAIEAQYASYQRGVRNRDIKRILGTMTSDVTTVYPSGRTFGRKEAEASLRRMLAGLRSVDEWTIRIAHLSLGKASAVATVGERMVTTFADGRGKLHKQTLVDFYQDTWVRQNNVWRLRNTKVLRGTLTMDGKVVDPFK